MRRAARSAILAMALSGCGANHADNGPDSAPDADVGPAADAAGAAAADTLDGIITVTGADPLTRVVLRTGSGTPVTLTGPAADTLRAAEGLDVRVVGRRVGDAVEVRAFRVRRLGDLPAADGRLELDGDVAVLVTADGTRLRYPDAPAGLRSHAGRRVWIAGAPGAEPQQWGLLGP